MSQPNLAAMRAVADRLDSLGLDYAFVGGSIVNLLLDNPALSPARPTDDVDVILEAVTAQRYAEVPMDARESHRGHHADRGWISRSQYGLVQGGVGHGNRTRVRAYAAQTDFSGRLPRHEARLRSPTGAAAIITPVTIWRILSR
jgi:hypothetical protein